MMVFYKKWSMNEQKGMRCFSTCWTRSMNARWLFNQAGDTLLIPGGWIHKLRSLIRWFRWTPTIPAKMQFTLATQRERERERERERKRNQCVQDICAESGCYVESNVK